jgi:chromosomal replication initiation ATPase DnaA
MDQEQKEEPLTSPWVYAGLKHPMKLMVLNRHTSAHADLNGILECCSIVFNVTRDDILGQCRKQEYALARHAFVKLARDRTQESFTSIADFLGKRNHATAVNGKRRAEALIETYKLFRDQYEMCESLLTKAETVKETYKMQELSERLRLIRQFNVNIKDDSSKE